MTNLTLSIDEGLIKQARIRAIEDGTSLSAKVREFLAQYVSTPAKPYQPVELPVFRGGGGLLPGIDPCSNKSFLDAMDG
jgi:plasmid stability protein